jgi:hypothetical protein
VGESARVIAAAISAASLDLRDRVNLARKIKTIA